MDLAVAMLHAEQPDGRQYQLHGRLFAEDRGRGVALGDVDQDALAELDRLHVIAIGAQRFLGIGAAVAIVEERLWHAALMQRAKIVDTGDVLHERSPAQESCIGRFRGHLSWLDTPPNRLREGPYDQAAPWAFARTDQGKAGPRRCVGGGAGGDLPGLRSGQRHPAGAKPRGWPCQADGVGSVPPRSGTKSGNIMLTVGYRRARFPGSVMVHHIF